MQSTSALIRFLFLAAAFFAIAGLLIVFGVFDRCSRSASEAAIAAEIKEVPPIFNLTDTQLIQAYLDDEESAVETLNGQVGIVRGTSRGIRTNHFRFGGNGVWRVRCFVSNAEADKVEDQWDSLRRALVVQRVSNGLSVGGSGRILVFKGRVEGINNKHLTIDLRGCSLHDDQ